ncbi:MAG: hypothetical protein HKN82_14455 [Akkermansiaceae bacterium]|nr:hypothetical protein [Akkermansiaceae bacterium]
MCQQPPLIAERSDLGSTLRQARQLQGRSLQDVTSVTRIPARVLAALEENDLPGSLGNTYARNYLVQYAQHLGVPLKPFERALPAADPFHLREDNAVVPGHSRIIFTVPADAPERQATRRAKKADRRPRARSYRTPGYSAVLVAIATGLILTSALRAYIGIEQSLARADAAAEGRATPDALVEFPGARPQDYRPMAALPAPPEPDAARPAGDAAPAAAIDPPTVAGITRTPPRAIIVDE